MNYVSNKYLKDGTQRCVAMSTICLINKVTICLPDNFSFANMSILQKGIFIGQNPNSENCQLKISWFQTYKNSNYSKYL